MVNWFSFADSVVRLPALIQLLRDSRIVSKPKKHTSQSRFIVNVFKAINSSAQSKHNLRKYLFGNMHKYISYQLASLEHVFRQRGTHRLHINVPI